MNGYEIETILSKFPSTSRFYRDCCPVDSLSDSQNKFVQNSSNIFVVNTANSDEKFGHWLLLFFNSSNICYFVDSYGREPKEFDERISKFVAHFTKRVIHNPRKLQQSSSCVCGLYVIFFSVFLCTGYSLTKIISWFSKPDLRLNDISVLKFLRKRVRLPKTSQLLECEFKEKEKETRKRSGKDLLGCRSCKLKWMPASARQQ